MIIFTFLFVLLNLISYNGSMGELELRKYLKVIKNEKYYHTIDLPHLRLIPCLFLHNFNNL